MPVTIDLSGQHAWVTGAASGIGAAIASTLAHAGARVVSLDRANPDIPVRDAVRTSPIRVRLDVRDGNAVNAVARELVDAGFAPDILVNNAGLARDRAVWNLSDSWWDEVIDVNLSGAFRLTRAAASVMRARGSGTIVNIASINGLRGKFGQSNYAASKGGLIAFTRALARELGPRGIRVNAIAPGMVDTPLTQALPQEVMSRALEESALGRLGTPDDVASAVLYLVSPLATHVTGHVLVVDGGQTA